MQEQTKQNVSSLGMNKAGSQITRPQTAVNAQQNQKQMTNSFSAMNSSLGQKWSAISKSKAADASSGDAKPTTTSFASRAQNLQRSNNASQQKQEKP